MTEKKLGVRCAGNCGRILPIQSHRPSRLLRPITLLFIAPLAYRLFPLETCHDCQRDKYPTSAILAGLLTILWITSGLLAVFAPPDLPIFWRTFFATIGSSNVLAGIAELICELKDIMSA